jgi:ribonuclease PH
MRSDGRDATSIRNITVKRSFTTTPAGSVLWTQGNTIVLCTASIAHEVPPWFGKDRPGGWVTADYVMLPGSTPRRKDWPKLGHTDSRGTEIQRLIGRSVRAILDLNRIGPHTIHLDCQVLQADGGTRTACISASYVALVDALSKLPGEFPMPRNAAADIRPVGAEQYDPARALTDQLAAISVGVVDGEIRVDLDYADDSRAEVDMNIALTRRGRFVEIQGSAEQGEGFDRECMETMVRLAGEACQTIFEVQSRALIATP